MVRNSRVWWFKAPSRKVAPASSVDGIFTIDMSASSTSTLDIDSVSPAQKQVSPEMQTRRHSILWHLLIDLPIFLLVTAICLLLELGAVPSRQSGYRCGDPALSFPYTGDTFSIPLVACVTILLPFVILWASEAALYREDEYNMKKNKFIISAKTAAVIYRDYIYTAVVNLTILEVVKCVVGSPRPTFFDLCQPTVACNGSEWVSRYSCRAGARPRYLQLDAGRSFPSAHAALAVHCGLFVAWYLQRRAFSWRNRSALLVPALQLLAALFAAVCALSRLSDHRHHWWDVLVGAAMGAAAAVFAALVLCRNFPQPALSSSSDLSSSDGAQHQSVRRLLAGPPAPV